MYYAIIDNAIISLDAESLTKNTYPVGNIVCTIMDDSFLEACAYINSITAWVLKCDNLTRSSIKSLIDSGNNYECLGYEYSFWGRAFNQISDLDIDKLTEIVDKYNTLVEQQSDLEALLDCFKITDQVNNAYGVYSEIIALAKKGKVNSKGIYISKGKCNNQHYLSAKNKLKLSSHILNYISRDTRTQIGKIFSIDFKPCYPELYSIFSSEGFEEIYDEPGLSINSVYDVIQSNVNKYSVANTYKISNLTDIVILDIMECIKNSTRFNKCNNCSRYFVPQSKITEKYCDNIFENTGKSCKVIGPKRKREQWLNLNPQLKERRAIYEDYYNKYVRGYKDKSMRKRKIAYLNQNLMKTGDEINNKVEFYKKNNEYSSVQNAIENYFMWADDFRDKHKLPTRKQVK